MAGWQDGIVETNGIRLHYTRTGRGTVPIVMAHGLTDNGLAWSKLAHVLDPAYDLVMVDARGHGLSEKPETGYSPQDHMLDMVGLIQALGLDRPVVMGHSMGAVTATWVSAEYPELVRATVLEDPPWRWPTSVDTNMTSKRTAYEDWRTRLELRKMLSSAESYARGRRERPLWSPEDHDTDVPAKEQVALQVLEFILHHEQTWMEQAAKFESPALLIYGNPARGGIVGADIAAEAHRLNSLIEPVQIASAGHNLRREQFDEYVAVIREFLARIQRQ